MLYPARQISFIALLCGVVIPARAVASDPDPREIEARKKCDAGETRAAVVLLGQRYVETRDPIYVYRQAECFARNGHDENAIERYRAYLSRRHRAPQGQPAIESTMGRPAAEPPAFLLRGAPVRLAATATPDPVPAAGTRANPAPAQSWQRWSSLGLAAAAGVALGTGITFHVAREDSVRQYNLNCFPLSLGACDQMEARVKVTQTGAVIGYLAAVLLGGASTTFYFVAPESRKSRPTGALAALDCSPWADGSGLACGGRF
jgi:hypothetical protein